MPDRLLPVVIATIAVVLIAAIIWDVFAPAPRPKRRIVDKADSMRAVPVAPAISVSGIKDTQPPRPATGTQVGYFDQLARADSRRRIRASAGYTYLGEVVAESEDSTLHRWNERDTRPVRVYIHDAAVANFQPAFVDAVRNALNRWAEAGVPVRFAVNPDSTIAEVHFRWRVQFDIDRTGQTDLTWDQDGHITSAVITIATFDPHGLPLGPEDVQVVAIHELGHALGLDHSSDPGDMMFASTRVRDLSARDVRTAVLLYQLAPGSLR